MVMEEEPSPEFVGREFVRQYYTVMHACPENLHRFYNTDSSFVHGGLEQPGESTRVAKGQAEIHKRIMSLNLRDCRAKIRQVDSFETVNGALVIQVIGELGNSGDMMRRFVQTFVLVQQSPKSYYVNNDIFRYQDDVFRDEETESNVQVKTAAAKQRPDDAMDSSSSVFVQPSQDHHVPSSGTESYANGNWSESDEKKTAHHQSPQVVSAAPAAPFSQQQVQNVSSTATREAQQSMPFDQQVSPAAAPVPSPAPEAAETSEPSDAPAPAPAPKEPINHKSPEHSSQENRAPAAAITTAPVSTKPLTFAAVAGGGRTSPATGPVAVTRQTHPPQHPPKTSQAPPAKPPSNAAAPRDKSPEHSTHGSISGGDDSEGHHAAGEGHHVSQQGGSSSGRGSFRPSSLYPNEQQVFVGNLPQDVSDEELQEFMTKFGGVVEVKICNKQSGRQQQGRVTPAFAFVTFENVEAVDKMLNTLPINDFRGHMRLNIERKQERERERGNFYGQGSGGQGGNYRGGPQGGSGAGSAGQSGASGRGGMRGGMSGGRRYPGPPRGGGGSFDNRQ